MKLEDIKMKVLIRVRSVMLLSSQSHVKAQRLSGRYIGIDCLKVSFRLPLEFHIPGNR